MAEEDDLSDLREDGRDAPRDDKGVHGRHREQLEVGRDGEVEHDDRGRERARLGPARRVHLHLTTRFWLKTLPNRTRTPPSP